MRNSIAVLISLALVAGCTEDPPGAATYPAPKSADDFRLLVDGGIDDRINSYPWGVALFDGDGDGVEEIYIGSLSNALCIQVPINQDIWTSIPGLTPPDAWQCDESSWDTEDWAPYVLDNLHPAVVFRGTYDEAEDDFTWDRVFEPEVIEATGFRGAAVYKGRLYMMAMGYLNGAMVYGTSDGESWTRASERGVMEDHASVNDSVRAATVFDDTLYVGSASVGYLYQSDDPAPGNWSMANSGGMVDSGADPGVNGPFWDLAEFEDRLYAAPLNREGGELWYSPDPAPGGWERVISGGHGQPDTLGFMTVTSFRDHVYVGTVVYPPLLSDWSEAVGTEVLRVDADGDVELLVGETRDPGTPDEIAPSTGMGPGFDYGANLYSWTARVYDDTYYLGTFDAAILVLDMLDEMFPDGIPAETEEALAEGLGDDRDRWRGFDLYYSEDGETFHDITLDGLGNTDNYGVRAMVSTPWGLLVGAANPLTGFELFLGRGEVEE